MSFIKLVSNISIKTDTAKTTLKKKKTPKVLMSHYYNATVINKVWYWLKDIHTRSME